jgi:GT2 family glycosyltransferase
LTLLGAGDLAVVIPTRSRWEILRLTLAALRDQTATGFETVVVVDGTDQEVPELPGVRVLQQEHAGPGAARNRGVAGTERALVLFIGDDMVPRPDFVARHLAAHEQDPGVEVAVLGRSVWHPDVPRDRLHRWLEWSSALFEYRLLGTAPHPDVGWPRFYSSNVSLGRELFDAVGGFDTDFVFDYEDLDIAWRLGQRGMRVRYEPRAVTQHLHTYDWDAVRRRYESRGGAERLMKSKHDWFEPWFHGQLTAATSEPPASRLWTYAVDLVPYRLERLRRAAETRATRHYRQRLAPAFFAAWDDAERREVSSRRHA